MRFNDRGKMRGIRTSRSSDVLIVWPWGEGRVSLYVHACFALTELPVVVFLSRRSSTDSKPPDQKTLVSRPYEAFRTRRAGSAADCAPRSQAGPVISRHGWLYYHCVHVTAGVFKHARLPFWCSCGHLLSACKTRRGVEWPRLTR